MIESGQPPGAPILSAGLSQSVRFFMSVSHRLPRPVVVERLTEPDGQIVVMHLRHFTGAPVIWDLGGVLLLDHEQPLWKHTFGVRLDMPNHLIPAHYPELMRLVATPDAIPPGVALTE